MSKSVGHAELVAMMQTAAARIQASHELLSKLDAATGDGDHGATMLRVAAAMNQSIQECSEHTPHALLEALGWGVMGVDGGSTGPLLGSLLMGMAEGADSADGKVSLSCADLATAFEAGLARLCAQTPAKVGDKTLVDALAPAVQALRAAASAGQSIDQALQSAAAAAAQGAQSTRELQARFGRARNLGARTIGQLDPGAMSIALLFEGFATTKKGK